jgi:hypothetical protein
MEAIRTRVLIVATSAEPTEPLVDAVRRRAAAGPCEFTLLVPAVAHGFHTVVDPEDQCCEEAEATIGALLPQLQAAAGGAPVAGRVGSHEVLAAVEDAVYDGRFAEAIVAAAPARVARLFHVDLARKISALGVVVTQVPARHARTIAA